LVEIFGSTKIVTEAFSIFLSRAGDGEREMSRFQRESSGGASGRMRESAVPSTAIKYFSSDRMDARFLVRSTARLTSRPFAGWR